MMRFVICSFVAVLPFVQPVLAEKLDRPEVRAKMQNVYQAFTALQPYLASEDKFLAEENDPALTKLISALSLSFHSDELEESSYASEPGFISTLEILNDLLDDARNRFGEGNKGYALWRLRTASNYCVTCHTRHEVKVDFSGADLSGEHLNSFEIGEYYLATRQFEKAGEEFLNAARDPELIHQRLPALRKWLLVQTRVHPDPQGAIKALTSIRNRQALGNYEDEVIRAWLASLRRWNTETPFNDPLLQAKNLIGIGKKLTDPLEGANGSVELLRATAILHGMLDDPAAETAAQRAEVLYLLGLAYSELPLFFVNQLPELFLESCIREFPNSDEAKRSFRLYQKIVTLGFTGSGGTRIPADVEATLKELHDLAYGIPVMKERI